MTWKLKRTLIFLLCPLILIICLNIHLQLWKIVLTKQQWLSSFLADTTWVNGFSDLFPQRSFSSRKWPMAHRRHCRNVVGSEKVSHMGPRKCGKWVVLRYNIACTCMYHVRACLSWSKFHVFSCCRRMMICSCFFMIHTRLPGYWMSYWCTLKQTSHIAKWNVPLERIVKMICAWQIYMRCVSQWYSSIHVWIDICIYLSLQVLGLFGSFVPVSFHSDLLWLWTAWTFGCAILAQRIVRKWYYRNFAGA